MATEAVARDTMSLASIKTVSDAANESKTLLGEMRQAATDAGTTLTEIYQDAKDAETAAGEAQTSAASAQNSANGALNGLSTVQDVIGVLDWAKDNATYTLTSDTDIVPGKTYWTRSGSGTEADPYTYTPVVNPDKADLGTYYEISGVDEAMADYINTHLALTDEGLYVLGGANQWKVLIATDGVYIIDGTTGVDKVVAKYKDIITLGIDDGSESYQKLDYHSLQLVDKEGYIYFHVSDLRDEHGIFNATDTFLGNGNDRTFTLSFAPVNLEWIVSVDGTVQTSGFTKSGQSVRFDNAPASGAQIVIKYASNDMNAKAYTFGIRDNSAPVGGLSVAEGVGGSASGNFSHVEGRYCVASARCGHAEGEVSRANGDCSHAEGYYTAASGIYSHAEGLGTTASEDSSHAEGVGTTASGYNSHAEGYGTIASESESHAEGLETTASGQASHAEGDSTIASGFRAHAEGGVTIASGSNSHAQNFGTIAAKSYQTAIGKYNLEDTELNTSNQKAFIIGNGTDKSNRSNAFTVDWDGNTEMQGRATTADMTAAEITTFINELRGAIS